jgi:hypothetical protein
MKPLDFESALLFLEKAVEGRQRRTSSYFLAAAMQAGGGPVPSNFMEYAQGQDSISDMVKGVATVIVDRGFRIERGMAYSDRILGSAFFIDSSGLLITNYHVIESASSHLCSSAALSCAAIRQRTASVSYWASVIQSSFPPSFWNE